MHSNIEEFFNENLSLRKAYQLSKTQNDSLTKQVKDLRQKLRQLQENYNSIADQNNRLYQKNKSLQAQLNNNNASFVSQIEELKSLIEHKENELENFQLKMIPTLDQDMLRVKLIAEMEGPYQEEVEKRDREISRLKEQIHQLKREKEITEFSLSNKERELKKEIEDSKVYYENEIDRLTRQLAHFTHKSSSGKVDREMIKSYRQQADNLRSTCEFMKNVEEQLRKEVGELRMEREKLLILLKNANAQKAVQMQQGPNETVIKELKAQKSKLEDSLEQQQREVERMKQRLKMAEDEKSKIESKMNLEIKDLKHEMEQLQTRARNENEETKTELRKMRDVYARKQLEFTEITDKYRALMTNKDSLLDEVRILKNKVTHYELDLTGTSRVEDTRKIERELREKIQQQLRIIITEQYKKQQNPINQSPTTDKNPNKPQQQPNKTKKLQQKIEKLTKKLQAANRKILELLKYKASSSTERDTNNESFCAQREYHKILLENRDCGFVPMCPPVLVGRTVRM